MTTQLDWCRSLTALRIESSTALGARIVGCKRLVSAVLYDRGRGDGYDAAAGGRISMPYLGAVVRIFSRSAGLSVAPGVT